MGWRDRKFPVILLLCLLSQVPYASNTVNMGWVAVDHIGSKGVVEEVFEVVGDHLADYVSIDPYVPLALERIEHKVQLEALQERHESIASSDGDSTRVETPVAEANPLVEGVQWNMMDLPRALEVPLTKGDRTIIRYVMDRWDLDVLLVGVVEPFDVLSRLRIVEYRSDGSVSNVHDALSANDSIPSLVPQAIATTMDYFSPLPLGIVQLSKVVPGLAIDGVPFDRYLVKESGTYELTATAPGYDVQKLPVAVESSQVTTAVVELKQQVGDPLLVTSESGLGFITIEHVVEQQVPFVWRSRKTPFSLHAEEPGFIPLDLMYDDVGKEIILDFQPLWMNPVFGTKRMQDEVYASLGRTLVATALVVVLDSVSRTVVSYSGDWVPWQPVMLGAVGATAVSAFDTLSRLFAYYQKTKYSSR